MASGSHSIGINNKWRKSGIVFFSSPPSSDRHKKRESMACGFSEERKKKKKGEETLVREREAAGLPEGSTHYQAHKVVRCEPVRTCADSPPAVFLCFVFFLFWPHHNTNRFCLLTFLEINIGRLKVSLQSRTMVNHRLSAGSSVDSSDSCTRCRCGVRWWIPQSMFSFLLLLVSVETLSLASATRMHYIHWNTTNPM